MNFLGTKGAALPRKSRITRNKRWVREINDKHFFSYYSLKFVKFEDPSHYLAYTSLIGPIPDMGLRRRCQERPRRQVRQVR